MYAWQRVEIDLSEIATSDLIEEMKERGYQIRDGRLIVKVDPTSEHFEIEIIDPQQLSIWQ